MVGRSGWWRVRQERVRLGALFLGFLRAEQNARRAEFVGHNQEMRPDIAGVDQPRGSAKRPDAASADQFHRPAIRHTHLHGEVVVIVQGPGLEGQTHLLQIVNARYMAARMAPLLSDPLWQEHRSQDRNDCHDNEELDQRERLPTDCVRPMNRPAPVV